MTPTPTISSSPRARPDARPSPAPRVRLRAFFGAWAAFQFEGAAHAPKKANARDARRGRSEAGATARNGDRLRFGSGVAGVQQAAGVQQVAGVERVAVGTRVVVGALMALAALGGCAHQQTAPAKQGPAPPTAAELPPPDSIPGTFTLRQKLTATSAKGGGSFEAVLQKQPGTLTLVGLTPYGSRAFLLQQTKGDVSFTKYIPRDLPFAPTFLLLDIHRVLATWIGPPLVTGDRSGQAGDETIHERWQDGKLIERTFTNAKAQPPGTITISYAGYGASNIATATHITLRNARLDYRVDIETVPFQ